MEFKNHILKNSAGTEIHVTNFGGIITKILTRDREGKYGNIVLGFPHSEDYQKIDHPYFGALIGRYGNRIARGKFTLDGKIYQLAVNNGPNALHGGLRGFDKVFWDTHQTGNKITLTYQSQDGEEGYPGNLKTIVTYELTENDEWRIDYEAETDKATPINLTQHSYFNLSAGKNPTILDHVVQIFADAFTEVDDDLTPTGKILSVHGTAMDLTQPKRVGDGIAYDHNWVLKGSGLKLAATVRDQDSGRAMQVFTTEPGIQFYAGNFLDGKLYPKNGGLCLETQHFPDSPNHPNFPDTILRPGKKYRSTSIYKFGVE